MARETGSDSAKQTVLIVGDGARAKDLKAKLSDHDYDVVGTAATAATAAKIFKSKEPKVVVLHLSPDHLETARAMPALLTARQCPLIAVAETATPELIDAACAASACGFITGVITGDALAAQIRVSCSRFSAFETLMQEKAQIAQSLETRKYVDRAKAILIKRAGLSEPEAHRRLQQESQRRRLSMAEVAKRIVETDEMMGDAS